MSPPTLSTFLSGSVVPERKPPVAAVVADPAFGVIGSVVKLNGQHSYDPSALPPRSGSDSTTEPDGNLIGTTTGAFTTADLGRVITLTGTDAGSYLVISILGTEVIQVSKVDGSSVSFSGGFNSWVLDDLLVFSWSFVKVPIGSNVIQEGFRVLEPDSSLVSFSPDIVGEYIVQLVVSNPVFPSAPASTRVSVKAILVPHAQGIIPDGKFVWQYLRDVWQHVEGREFFETFWSALIQIVGGEMLKLYQNDFNKSIRDIQDLYQRRWLSYEPELGLDGSSLTFYLGNQVAGIGATTRNLGESGKIIILSTSEFIVVEGSILDNIGGKTFNIVYDENTPSNAHAYTLQGTNLTKTGYFLAGSPTPPDPTADRLVSGMTITFTFRSKNWTLHGPTGSTRVGDVICLTTGPNTGFYRITSLTGSAAVVDKTPTAASDSTTADIYRPVDFRMNTGAGPTSSAFAVPLSSGVGITSLAVGRVLVVGDQTFTLLRSVQDPRQAQELVVVTTDGGEVLTNLDGLAWRAPHTLVSTTQNFEDLGVTAGDLLTLEVMNKNNGSLFELPAQVVGVDRFRLGFVLNVETVQDGVVPTVPSETIVEMASEFGIGGASLSPQGSLQTSGDALKIISTLQTGLWQSQYFNQALDPTSLFNVQGGVFTVLPKSIRRNRQIPVDPLVVSIPVLQDWIVQPKVVEDAGVLYQECNGQRFEIPNPPYSLIENSDFVIDGELAVSDTLVFNTGSDVVVVEDGRFQDRDLHSGDSFQILSPENLVGTYLIKTVLSPNALLLSSALPDVGRVAARVQIHRRKGGTFIHFVANGFTAKKPAPKRFWAEVSFFDNFEAVENNFGILVELKRSDLEDISSDLNYRQAVAGLMFAYTKGPAISKMRLGAQILLGLPFAEHAGIIRSIENDYRLDPNGSPVQGRILIEDTDNSGKPMGVMRVYIYPIDPISELAGLDTNPATGKLYVVGDAVLLFAALSKGVEVDDYLNKPLASSDPARAWLQQFNSFKVRANDNLFTLEERTLLSRFLKNISPSSVAMILISSAEFADTVTVGDSVSNSIRTADGVLVDTPYFGSPTPEMFDTKTLRGHSLMISDVGFFQSRLFMPGLATVLNAATITVPRSLVTGEGLIAKNGDFVWFPYGPNAGFYAVTNVAGSILTLDGLPASGLQGGAQDALIVRKVGADLRSGAYSSAGPNSATIPAGSREDYVGPGDLFLTDNGDCLPIISIGDAGALTLLGTPSATPGNFHIVRKALIESPFQASWARGTLVSNGISYTTLTGGFFKALLEVGDELEVTGGTQHLQVLDAARLVFVPVLPAGSYTVSVCKRGHKASPISVDHPAMLGPGEQVDVGLKSASSATCTAGSSAVSLGLNPVSVGVLPGDFLVLSAGGNSIVDVGYGPGIYPIISVNIALVLLAANLTSNDGSPWTVLRRR